ncbi:hypothetical protein [Streptomyces sp. NBC_00328]|uniref:hypothetical protein n=1 Tax=Streptomyces sp. NBC_00328 TaxID=2903646 RepID=UPI002E2E7FED|nr:hypothetical protein [Streptomyces sp. NBC_00328]
MARQRGGRPWGPVRAESTEAEALAVFLRAQVDFSGKTLKVLEGEILHSKAKISEHLGGRVPDLAFVTALIRATIPEPQLRNRRLTEARELLQAAAHPSPRRAPPPSATALELAEVRTQQVEVYDRLTRSLEQQNELREAAGNSAKLVMVLLSMISSLKRTITDLTSERDQLRAARATPDTLQQTQQQLARAREQDARARQELKFAQDKQRQAEELATQVQARADQLTDELDRLRTAATVPAAVGEDEMPAGRRAEPVSSGDPVGDDIDQALDQVAAVNEHDDQMLQRITHDLVRDVLPAERVVPDNPQDPVPRRRLGAVTEMFSS